MQNLIVDNVKYRGYNFCKNLAMVDPFNYKFFSLKEFDWFFVETKTDIKKYAFRHGSKVSGTSNGVRTFTLTFTAFASDEKKRMELIRLVSTIFNPPLIMSDTDGFHDLEFTTPDGGERTCKAQTTRRPRMFDTDNIKRVSFEVQLVAEDGNFLLSKTKNIIKDHNTRMGKQLNFTLPSSSIYHNDSIDYRGTNSTPVDAKITAIRDISLPRLYIRSYVDNELQTTIDFGEMELKKGESIVVDGYNESIYKVSNGIKTVITNQMKIYSQYPILADPLSPGTSLIVDCGYTEKVLDVSRGYYEVWG